MRKVYICSRYRADEQRTVEENVDKAAFACRYAILKGYSPYAPHLYLPRCLNDDMPTERDLGLRAAQDFLKICEEVWQFDTDVSEGMAAELELAEELKIPIRVFDNKDKRISKSTVYAQWVNLSGQASRFICAFCGAEHEFIEYPLPEKCPTCEAMMYRKGIDK